MNETSRNIYYDFNLHTATYIGKPRILATADSFYGIEKAVRDYFKSPVKLIMHDNEWCVYRHNPTPFGTIHHYYVMQKGRNYWLEMREIAPTPKMEKVA